MSCDLFGIIELIVGLATPAEMHSKMQPVGVHRW